MDNLFGGIDLDKRPLLEALTRDTRGVYDIGREFGYKELEQGYISKCHLCTDIRKYLVGKTKEFTELKPVEFYQNLG